jgi:hypothetical protein
MKRTFDDRRRWDRFSSILMPIFFAFLASGILKEFGVGASWRFIVGFVILTVSFLRLNRDVALLDRHYTAIEKERDLKRKNAHTRREKSRRS